MAKKERTMEQRLARVEAYMEIANIMGRYANWHTARMRQEQAELFALDNKDTYAEMVWGRYYGGTGVTKLFPGLHAAEDTPPEGKMFIHSLSTPVIEVAEDLKTAKAIWISPGTMCGPDDETGEFYARWAWTKYGVDFICEDGQWKIWHLRTSGIFDCDYHRSWVEDEQKEVLTPEQIMEDRFGDDVEYRRQFGPDEPAHFLERRYSTKKPFVLDPPVPMPYETYEKDDKWM